MEYHAAIKNDEFVSFVGTWTNLETVILSNLTQEQKVKHRMFSLTEMAFHHVDQAGLQLLTSGDLPALASQSIGITDVMAHTCNLSTLGGRGGWISRAQEFKTTLGNM
ncbi:retrotransposable element ORF2 protein, partial [Plecturocebus cupreus]